MFLLYKFLLLIYFFCYNRIIFVAPGDRVPTCKVGCTWEEGESIQGYCSFFVTPASCHPSESWGPELTSRYSITEKIIVNIIKIN